MAIVGGHLQIGAGCCLWIGIKVGRRNANTQIIRDTDFGINRDAQLILVGLIVVTVKAVSHAVEVRISNGGVHWYAATQPVHMAQIPIRNRVFIFRCAQE